MEGIPPGSPSATPTTPSQIGGEPGPDRPPPSDARRSKGPGQDTQRGTDNVKRPYQRPVPGPREVRTPHHPGGGERTPREGTRGLPERETGPSSRNAQTAWNGVPASEGKGHLDGTARHTQRGTRGAGKGKRERHNTRYRPAPSKPAASAAHTQTGHCTRQGSSGALRPTPNPRLGSLRASPRGSHWRQASSTGPAAPAPRATTHYGGDAVGKRLQPRLRIDALTGEWRNREAVEGWGSEPCEPGGLHHQAGGASWRAPH